MGHFTNMGCVANTWSFHGLHVLCRMWAYRGILEKHVTHLFLPLRGQSRECSSVPHLEYCTPSSQSAWLWSHSGHSSSHHSHIHSLHTPVCSHRSPDGNLALAGWSPCCLAQWWTFPELASTCLFSPCSRVPCRAVIICAHICISHQTVCNS